MLFLLLFCYATMSYAQFIDYPDDGFATLTHYSLPLDYVAACGCAPASTHYPTVALSQMAFGSSIAFGPGCGRCFKITLLNSFTSTPPFFPNVTKSVVVKVTDLCPIVSNWCGATPKKTNQAGAYLNFDLAWPSPSIPEDFFPSDSAVYGYSDFGVWNISYAAVPCSPDWQGSSDTSSLGAVTYVGSESACCPADPFTEPDTTCPSYSELNDIPPDAAPGVSSASSLHRTHALQSTLRIPIYLPGSLLWPFAFAIILVCIPLT